MNRHVFNACMGAGWAMATSGAALVSLPLGLLAGGALLIVLTLLAARMASAGVRG